MAIGSESYENFALAMHGKKFTRKRGDGLIELDSVWSMTEVESDQFTSQTRLTSIFSFYSAMNKENDDLGGGKTLQTNCSANLCCGSDGPGTARRVFDPGGLGALPQINEAAGEKARSWPAQIARRATGGACLSYVEKFIVDWVYVRHGLP